MSVKPPIVLIHGLWLTPESWSRFRNLYEARGHRVLTPGYPNEQGGVDEQRGDPRMLAGIGMKEIVDHLTDVVTALDERPILIGHSVGGLAVQILLDRGLGAAGVAIDSVPPRGVLLVQPPVLRSSFPVLKNPANVGRAVTLTFEEFRYSFANAVTETEARDFYDRDTVPAPGRPLFQAALSPFHSATRVNYRNQDRAPLLLIAGSDDHQIVPSVVRWNHRKYARSRAVTDLKEFPGRGHLMCMQPGWEEVAESALDWALSRIPARETAPIRP